MKRLLALAVLLAVPTSALAEEGWTVKGWLSTGSRNFLVDRDRGLKDDNVNLEGEVELTWDSGGPFRARLRPRLAVDVLESSRNRYEPLDAYVEGTWGDFNLRAGQMIESWKIVDTFNPADILNRRDLERDFYDPNPLKLGEVMLRLRYALPQMGGMRQPAVSLYLLPLFRETPLPGNEDRFRFDINGDNRGDLLRDGIRPNTEIAYATRVAATVFDADVFAFYFGGPGRIPSFAVTSPTFDQLRPVYYRVDMVGGGLQWPVGPFLIKFENAYTFTQNNGLPDRFQSVVPDSYYQFVIGIDRTFTDILGKNEITVTVEFAGENNPGTSTLKDLRPYKSDLFVGVRWQFQDVRRTQVTAAAIVDVLVNEQLYKVDFETVLYKDVKLLLSGQFVNRAPLNAKDPLDRTVFNLFPDNSNVTVSLRYEF